jgi:hypothetical protein
MSKIALTPNATGTGVFTISSPATNTNRTLTLPDEAGTVLTSASSITQNAGPVAKARLNSVAPYVIADAVYTKVPYDTADVNEGGCLNITSSTVVLNGISVPPYSFGPNVAGYYLISASVGLYGLTVGTGRIFAEIRKNEINTRIWFYYLGVGQASQTASGSSILYLNGTSDTVSLYANQSNGGNRNFDHDAFCAMSACLIRRV